MKHYLMCNGTQTLSKVTPSCRFEAGEPRLHELRVRTREPQAAQLEASGQSESKVAVQAIHRRRPGDLSTGTKADRSAA